MSKACPIINWLKFHKKLDTWSANLPINTKIDYCLHSPNNDEASVFGDVLSSCNDSLNSESRIDFIYYIYDANKNIIPMSEEDICEDFRHEENNLYRDQIRIASQKLFKLLSKPTIFSTFMNESWRPMTMNPLLSRYQIICGRL